MIIHNSKSRSKFTNDWRNNSMSLVKPHIFLSDYSGEFVDVGIRSDNFMRRKARNFCVKLNAERAKS